MNNSFHRRDLKLGFTYLVINQITTGVIPIDDSNTLIMNKSGLSLSRNFAIKSSLADICLISDDDLTYVSDIENKILSVFKQYPNADIVTFKITNSDGSDYKKYSNKPFYHNLRSAMKVSSVEIAIRKGIFDDGLAFDEDFGLGAKYPTGEEVIFLTDALKQGKSILFYPLSIATHPDVSSGSNYNVENLAKAKGAMLYRVFSSKSFLLCLAFAVKHYNKTPYTLKKFTQELISGALEYRGLTKKKSKTNYN